MAEDEEEVDDLIDILGHVIDQRSHVQTLIKLFGPDSGLVRAERRNVAQGLLLKLAEDRLASRALPRAAVPSHSTASTSSASTSTSTTLDHRSDRPASSASASPPSHSSPQPTESTSQELKTASASLSPPQGPSTEKLKDRDSAASPSGPSTSATQSKSSVASSSQPLKRKSSDHQTPGEQKKAKPRAELAKSAAKEDAGKPCHSTAPKTSGSKGKCFKTILAEFKARCRETKRWRVEPAEVASEDDEPAAAEEAEVPPAKESGRDSEGERDEQLAMATARVTRSESFMARVKSHMDRLSNPHNNY